MCARAGKRRFRDVGTTGLVAATVLMLAGCGDDGRDALPGGPSSERLSLRPAGSVDGAPLGYAEYVPPGYGDGTPRPLLVFLHGVDENGDGSEAALGRLFKLGVPMLIQKDDWNDDRPFIVLMPQYGPDAAQDCRLADELDSFLKFALDHYDVEQARVYLTGVSCGAIGAWDYLAAHTDELVAGAVLIAGHATEAFAQAGCALGRVPVWAFHGDVDSAVPKVLIVTPIRDLEACTDPAPVDLQLTIYPETDHDSWSRTYDLSAGHDIYAWLLGHKHA
jgi:predicted peptidase